MTTKTATWASTATYRFPVLRHMTTAQLERMVRRMRVVGHENDWMLEDALAELARRKEQVTA